MIVGIGIDLIDMERVLEKVDKDTGFREAVFSKDEIDTCEGQGRRGESYAGRFAAKEAFLKATGLGLTLGYTLSDVDISNDDLGKPFMNLRGNFKVIGEKQGWTKIHVSITHTNSVAAAVVVIER